MVRHEAVRAMAMIPRGVRLNRVIRLGANLFFAPLLIPFPVSRETIAFFGRKTVLLRTDPEYRSPPKFRIKAAANRDSPLENYASKDIIDIVNVGQAKVRLVD